MRLMAVPTGVLGVLAIAAIVTGCGGESESEPLTKAEFTQQAEAICLKHDKATEAKVSASLDENKEVSAEEARIQLNTEVLYPSVDSELTELEGLSPPEGDEAKVAAILDAGRSGLEQAETEPERLLGVETDALKEFLALASKYGLEKCVTG
jgi:hypothetical protein